MRFTTCVKESTGTGAGSGLIGNVLKNPDDASYNVNGANGRKFMLHWLWDNIRKSCFGPNAIN
jgi:Phosphate-induced protein 1 conserved region